MITNPRKFYSGALLLGAFAAVLIAIFMPIFNGQNGLSYLDSLYNSISKGSAYYIPELLEDAASFAGREISIRLTAADAQQATEIKPLFEKSGTRVDVSGNVVSLRGDLAAVLRNALADADAMFANNGEALVHKYGYNERRVLYNWYLALKAADRELKKQKKFAEAKFIGAVLQKGVECSYNYYGIEAQEISSGYWLVIFSLAFYVIYTLWYGFGVLNLFEGLGLSLEH